jgi:RNA polymerase sigma-70 factor (ECF subfamily)
VHTTSASLLQRLRQPGEPTAWDQFVKLYTPLLYYWARRAGLQESDAADLVQDVFVVLLRELPRFTYDRGQSFRGWLRQVTLNHWRDHCRRGARGPRQADGADPDALADPADGSTFEEEEYRQYLVGRALRLMQANFEPVTWKACWEHVVSGRPAAAVAAELGITENAVYIAKCRVLRHLREQLDGLWD